MSDNAIEYQESPRTYFTQIPNCVDDMGLTPYAYRLYGHLRRVAGENGACWQSTSTLAKACRMSAGSVSKYKQELIEADLISVEERHNENGQYHHITIINIWRENHLTYAGGSSNESPSSPGESPMVPSSPGESPTPRGSSPGETKKNHTYKKNHIDANDDEQTDGRAWFLALTEVCVVELSVATDAQKGQLGTSAKMLKKAGATPEQIAAFGSWWYDNDWRGKKGQPPTPAQVRSEWGKFKRADSDGVVRVGR